MFPTAESLRTFLVCEPLKLMDELKNWNSLRFSKNLENVLTHKQIDVSERIILQIRSPPCEHVCWLWHCWGIMILLKTLISGAELDEIFVWISLLPRASRRGYLLEICSVVKVWNSTTKRSIKHTHPHIRHRRYRTAWVRRSLVEGMITSDFESCSEQVVEYE